MLVDAGSSPARHRSTTKRSVRTSIGGPSGTEQDKRRAVPQARRGTQQGASKMPKMKTKASAKKRFKITGSGKVLAAAAGKRHGMIKRSNKFIRDARGTMVLSDADAKIVKKFLPNGL
jgi:large subunit ribosomal protein L35